MDTKIPRIGVGVFIFKDGKFLMGQRKSSHGEGSWSVPGGHLEFSEEIEDTAEREVFEETGMKIKNLKIVGMTNDIFKAEDKHYLTVWVVSDWKSGKNRMVDPDKYINQKWFDFSSLPSPLFLPWKRLLKSDFVENVKKMLVD